MGRLIDLPKKGEVKRISSKSGKNAVVKRSGRAWVILYGNFIPASGNWSKARWGNAEETRADIVHFKEYGTVKRVKGKRWE